MTHGSLSPHRSVLVVDDEPQIVTATARYLSRRGFTVGTARNAREAIVLLGERSYDAMLCDVSMPDNSGLDLLPRALELDSDLAVVMLSGVNDAVTANTAMQRGATEYLVKPTSLEALGDAVDRAIGRRDAALQERRASRARQAQLSLRTNEVEAERLRLERVTVGVVEALIIAVEARDLYTRGRTERVARLAARIAEELGLEPDVVHDVRLAARLHDVGMLGIHDAVLNKPDALTPEEFEHVKDHVRIGMEILAPLDHLGAVLDFIQDHHERWDGTGYPRRIDGESISIGGRILAAADAFDTLVSGRSFRRPAAPAQALETMRYVVGSLLDPAVYDATRAVVERDLSAARTS